MTTRHRPFARLALRLVAALALVAAMAPMGASAASKPAHKAARCAHGKAALKVGRHKVCSRIPHLKKTSKPTVKPKRQPPGALRAGSRLRTPTYNLNNVTYVARGCDTQWSHAGNFYYYFCRWQVESDWQTLGLIHQLRYWTGRSVAVYGNYFCWATGEGCYQMR
jgi:hypothetical protein